MENEFEIELLRTGDSMMRYENISKDLIKNIETVVRKSYHYKIFIYYLKNFMDLDECSYYEGYSIKNGLSVELHHSPLTLYEIVKAVMTKHLKENGYFKIMGVAKEVSKLHYNFLVGLVPLNPTAHKLVHSGNLKVHPKIVKGDWEGFFIQYQDYASAECRKTVEDSIFIAEHEDMNNYPKILRRSETHYVQKGIDDVRTVNVSKMLTDIKLKSLDMIEESAK
ncbi:MAG: hypothetical protein IJ772_04620 [Bacilli bacterium]|nr:hypothetical protein [Bacilli bacterium]